MPKILLYHGAPIPLDSFTWESTINEVEQEGPGIYLTTSLQDARRYAEGKYVYVIEWNYKKLVSTRNASPSTLSQYERGVRWMIKNAPNWEDTVQNFDEDIERAVRIATSHMIQYSESVKDMYLNIWSDFYSSNPIEFCKNMTHFSYDGFMVKRTEDTTHAIVFNPNTIKIKEVIEVASLKEEDKMKNTRKLRKEGMFDDDWGSRPGDTAYDFQNSYQREISQSIAQLRKIHNGRKSGSMSEDKINDALIQIENVYDKPVVDFITRAIFNERFYVTSNDLVNVGIQISNRFGTEPRQILNAIEDFAGNIGVYGDEDELDESKKIKENKKMKHNTSDIKRVLTLLEAQVDKESIKKITKSKKKHMPLKEKAKQKLDENFMIDALNWFAAHWNDTSRALDEYGNWTGATNGENFRIVVSTILGVTGTAAIALTWEKIKSLLVKAPEKIKTIVKALKAAKGAQSSLEASKKIKAATGIDVKFKTA